MPVDTSKIDRRKVRYASPADLHADVAKLVAADRAGTLTACGNWTLGQALGHLATWINFAYDGYPIKPPFFVKWILKGRKDKYLHGSLPAGVRIPRVKDGTLGIDVLPTDEGLRRLNAAWSRLEAAAPTIENPIFGPLRHDEWQKMHLRHAELHLGCFSAETRGI
ncbi:MAG TPA: DUF1569 domain-containing protein [Phycisphaerales bacterium]|nr:DUF1569 domain-containing protein [Phycisphaerales bacterium]